MLVSVRGFSQFQPINFPRSNIQLNQMGQSAFWSLEIGEEEEISTNLMLHFRFLIRIL